MLDCYKNAWLVEPPEVLKRQLLPFSIGHAYLLEAFDSPLMTGGVPGMDDLVFGVWVCARPFGRGVEELRDVDRVLKECMKWGRKCRGHDLSDELTVFTGYMRAYFDCPERWQKGNTQTQPRVQWQFALVWALSGGRLDVGTHTDLWDLPVGLALSYNAARITAGGDDSVVGEDVADLIDGNTDDG